jgi:hypothetical protein
MDANRHLAKTTEQWLSGPTLLPEVQLDMPFEARWNPAPLGPLRQRYLQWLARFGLLTSEDQANRYLRHSIAELSTLSYPEATQDSLDMGYALVSITVMFDDIFDISAASQDPVQVVAAIKDLVRLTLQPPGTEPGVNAHPGVWAFADAWSREAEGMSPAWQARASADWRSWFSTWLVEATNRSSGRVPTPEEYASHRRVAVATGAYRDSVEAANRCECPPAITDSAQMHSIIEAYADCLGLVNDIYSVAVEGSRKDVHNIVTVLEQNLGITRDQAMAEAVRRSNEAVARMQSLFTTVPPLYDAYACNKEERAAAERFLDALGYSARANLEFSRLSPRYSMDLLLEDGSYTYMADTPALLHRDA